MKVQRDKGYQVTLTGPQAEQLQRMLYIFCPNPHAGHQTMHPELAGHLCTQIPDMSISEMSKLAGDLINGMSEVEGV